MCSSCSKDFSAGLFVVSKCRRMTLLHLGHSAADFPWNMRFLHLSQL